MRKRAALGIALAALLALGALGALYAAGRGLLGRSLGAGVPAAQPRPPGFAAAGGARDAAAGVSLGAPRDRLVLFGDLHVHTGFSADAFAMSMPLTGGSGSHTVADACDFARFCSGLDFWSINDHAESSTPRRWRETVEAVRHCDAVGRGSGPGQDADLVSFLGWEWSQMGTTAENHYGHRNVVLRDLDDAGIPARPVAADSPADYFQAPSSLMLGLLPLIAGDPVYLDYATYQQQTASPPRCADGVPVRELPADCREYAATPGELFAKLDDWGQASLVIPHGTSWGMYTPQGSSFARQLALRDHDPVRQRLVEIYSGHGNSEEYRAWREVEIGADGARRCPEPRSDYLPACWRAGEIIAERCRAAGIGAAGCDARAARARQHYAEAPSGLGHLSVPGHRAAEWRDAGQCRDCFLPAFHYRPASSVQAMLALSRDGTGGEPLRFRFGFVGSSDTHTARAGAGYKDRQRNRMSDARMARVGTPRAGAEATPLPESRAADPTGAAPDQWIERERAGSFYFTGGLVAVHAAARDRRSIWDALGARHTYATSGPRILLWFDLVNPPESAAPLPMGSAVALAEAPVFEVRAVGSLEQQPGCPDFARAALSAERLERLCGGECYHPSDLRRPIARIEIVRIRPQRGASDPLEPLIEDPWRVLPCAPGAAGCRVRFSDPEFAGAARDSVYYVRAIEAPGLAVNAGTLRCEGEGCARTTPCDPWAPNSDDCLAPVEERAWSSPIFVDWQAAGARDPAGDA